jgi:hypothetical protein
MYIPPLITTLLNSFCKDVTDRHTSAWLKDKQIEKNHLSHGTPESGRSAGAPLLAAQPSIDSGEAGTPASVEDADAAADSATDAAGDADGARRRSSTLRDTFSALSYRARLGRGGGTRERSTTLPSRLPDGGVVGGGGGGGGGEEGSGELGGGDSSPEGGTTTRTEDTSPSGSLGGSPGVRLDAPPPVSLPLGSSLTAATAAAESPGASLAKQISDLEMALSTISEDPDLALVAKDASSLLPALRARLEAREGQGRSTDPPA